MGNLLGVHQHVFPRCGETVGIVQHLPSYSVWAGGFLKRVVLPDVTQQGNQESGARDLQLPETWFRVMVE